MTDKEQIKDFMRNCSERQYEHVSYIEQEDKVYFFTVKYREGKRVREFRAGAKYAEHVITAELIFLTEKDERDYFFDAPCYDEMTPELGKYYLNKYSFLNVSSVNDTFRGIRYKVYNQRGQCVYSWYE